MTIRASAFLLASVAAVSFFAGCETQPPVRPASLPAVVDIGPTTLPGETLVIKISNTGGVFVDGWRVEDEDLSRLVQLRHVSAVTIKGEVAAPYHTFLHVHDILAGAGVTSITFVAVPHPPQ